jgi:Xaa-Pro aminopeptidase
MKKACIARRQRVLAEMNHAGGGVAIVPTAPEQLRNRDTHHPYRFDSYFWYLTAFPEPEAVLVLVGDPARPQSILFCREKDVEREVWDGFRYGPAAAQAAFGFDAAYPIAELETRLPDLLANRAALWHSLGVAPAWDQRIGAVLNGLRGAARKGQRPPRVVHDLNSAIDAMRLIKDATECDLLRQSCQIAAAGHVAAMRAARSGMAEYELEAELSYLFRRRGADAHAYPPIVASGVNACILHYTENSRVMGEHSLVLIDAGCEVRGYAADITRTFPVGGRFSGPQREAYEIVLAAQAAAFVAIRPGAAFIDYHDAAVRVLAQGMIDLGLLTGSLDGVIESAAYQRFYMHKTGHWLGLDVHDAGDYKDGEAWVTLVPGMTLTVEPGLYIPPAADVPTHLHGIGIRIEDDVLVTATGLENLTAAAPKTVAEIEEVMRHE